MELLSSIPVPLSPLTAGRVVLGVVGCALSAWCFLLYLSDCIWAVRRGMGSPAETVAVGLSLREGLRFSKQSVLLLASMAVMLGEYMRGGGDALAVSRAWVDFANGCQIVVLVLFIVTSLLDLGVRWVLRQQLPPLSGPGG